MSNNQLKNHESQHPTRRAEDKPPPDIKTFLHRGIKTVNRLHEHLKAI